MDEELQEILANVRYLESQIEEGNITRAEINEWIVDRTGGAATSAAGVATLRGRASEDVTELETPNFIPKPIRAGLDRIQQLGQGITGGGLDELAGLAQSFQGGGPVPRFDPLAFQEAQQETSGRMQEFKEQNPKMSTALNLIGGAATGGAAGARVVGAAPSIAQAVGRGAGLGAGLGSASGFLSGETTGERLAGAAGGGGLGALLGGATGGIGAGLGRAAGRAGGESRAIREGVNTLRGTAQAQATPLQTPVTAIRDIAKTARRLFRPKDSEPFKLADTEVFQRMADDVAKNIKARGGLAAARARQGKLISAGEAEGSAAITVAQPKLTPFRILAGILRKRGMKAGQASDEQVDDVINELLQSTDVEVQEQLIDLLEAAADVGMISLAGPGAVTGAGVTRINQLLEQR